MCIRDSPNGVRVDDGTIYISDMSATVGVRPLVDSGTYTVAYSLLSEGDVPLEGSFTFKYQSPSVISTANPNPEPTHHRHLPAVAGEQMYSSLFFSAQHSL